MNPLFLDIEDFYEKLQSGEFDEPLALATKLQSLADAAWVQLEELCQASTRIDP